MTQDYVQGVAFAIVFDKSISVPGIKSLINQKPEFYLFEPFNCIVIQQTQKMTSRSGAGIKYFYTKRPPYDPLISHECENNLNKLLNEIPNSRLRLIQFGFTLHWMV